MQYILGLLMAATIVFSIMMIVYVYFFAKTAIDYDIEKTVREANVTTAKYVSLKDKKLTVEPEFDNKEGNMTALVISENGEVLHGEYPEGAPQDIEIRLYHTQEVEYQGELWYFRDRLKGKLHTETGEEKSKIYIRTVVNRRDISSEYETMAAFVYLSIFLMCGGILMGGFFVSGKIKKSMDEMCHSAEKIGKNSDISQRITYEGNIYELDVLNAANNRMLDRMESILKQQEQFNSDVAHELRTPVSVTLAQCEYAEKHLENAEEVENAFYVIHRQSRKINDIISQLLYLARLEQGRSVVHLEEVDLQAIAESVCEDEMDNPEHEVEIRMELEEAETMGDISLIMIALQNLLNNAVKYADGKPVEVKTGQRENKVYVSVQDYGRGMTQEETEHIFERFYKVDKSRNSEGFGLGLSITAKIMELCHGEVAVESKEGEGSIFTLLFQKKE